MDFKKILTMFGPAEKLIVEGAEPKATTKQLNECGDMSTPGEVTLKGSPDSLLALMKLAGVAAKPEMPVHPVATMDMDVDEGNAFSGALAKAKASGADKFEVDGEEYEVEEAYVNEPEEEYQDVDTIMSQGNDLNRRKGAYKPAAGGDNPMAVRESLEDLEAKLFEELESIKLREGDFDVKDYGGGNRAYSRKSDSEGHSVYSGQTGKSEAPKKKGRGRPKKTADASGETMKPDWSAFGVTGGKVTPPNIGTRRKIKGRDMKDD